MYTKVNSSLQILTSLSFGRYNASLLDLPRVNIILFEDLAKKLEAQLYEPTSLIHVLFMIKPPLRSYLDTLVSDHVIYGDL